MPPKHKTPRARKPPLIRTRERVTLLIFVAVILWVAYRIAQ